MSDQLSIDPHTKARTTDPWTAHNAADAMAKMGKAGSQRRRLLAAFARLLEATSEEAAEDAPGVSLMSEYSTRCSELQRLELIEPTGQKRIGAAGVARDVYGITDRGLEVVAGGLNYRLVDQGHDDNGARTAPPAVCPVAVPLIDQTDIRTYGWEPS